MSNIEFIVPPLPHYIICGEDVYSERQSHPNRRNIKVFDMLVVTKGMLYIGEGDNSWKVGPGELLILEPDLYHYSTEPCDQITHFYWLHFQTIGKWSSINEDKNYYVNKPITSFHQSDLFRIIIPKYYKISNPTTFYEYIQQLLSLAGNLSTKSLWEEQIIFQQILQEIEHELEPKGSSAETQIAMNAVTYLQRSFHKSISYDQLSEALNFHSVYITRCMKKVYGYTPNEYLLNYRLKKAKLLLVNTDLPVSEIGERIGFSSTSYFTRTFTKKNNVSPSNFRKQFK